LNFAKATGGAWVSGESAWGDDFGTSSSGTTPYVSAYRTLASAMRIRIVGLPSGQFMTPGKIYFAQVRYDQEDLPVTEQDFVVLEQKGRASHVSADAVREAGSKTVYWTPDGAEKFGMTSNFILSPGLTESTASSPSTFRVFPDVPNAVSGSKALSAIIPYRSSAYVSSGIPTGGWQDNPDSANADSTSVLLIAYFGAQNGVVVEVNYANIIEYIPNKSSPAGVEALTQLPSSRAMDEIFSAAAVCSVARPMLIQSSGDKTISVPSPSGSKAHTEAVAVRRKLVSRARAGTGAVAETFLGDLLGSGQVAWNFDDSISKQPARRRV